MKQLLLGIGLLTLLGCDLATRDPQALNSEKFYLTDPDGAQVLLMLEVADEPKEMKKGLMHREQLDPDTGMLFAFEHLQPLSFWMKNTLIPLDIIFFGNKGEYVSHTGMVPCIVDPCPHYWAADLAQYAIELPAGTVDTYGIGSGWVLELGLFPYNW